MFVTQIDESRCVLKRFGFTIVCVCAGGGGGGGGVRAYVRECVRERVLFCHLSFSLSVSVSDCLSLSLL